MDLKDLQPIVVLLTEQEHRLCGKIDSVHESVREVDAKVTLQNGRVRKLEIGQEGILIGCKLKHSAIEKSLKEVEPTVKVQRIFRWIGNHPRLSGVLLFAFMLLSQVIVLLAVFNQWIGKIINLI
jgi:hypothetical protein